jgi:hypothetical protein
MPTATAAVPVIAPWSALFSGQTVLYDMKTLFPSSQRCSLVPGFRPDMQVPSLSALQPYTSLSAVEPRPHRLGVAN